MINRESKVSVMRQCELLGLCRSSLYYRPKPICDELHLNHPFLGARRLARILQRAGFDVGRRHVGSLMQLMGIEAIRDGPGFSDTEIIDSLASTKRSKTMSKRRPRRN